MKGATADPWVKTINPPNKPRTLIIGNIQYFFLTFKNSQNSLIKLILKLISHFTFGAIFFNPIRFILVIFQI